jgi:signal transduction histidine kinase
MTASITSGSTPRTPGPIPLVPPAPATSPVLGARDTAQQRSNSPSPRMARRTGDEDPTPAIEKPRRAPREPRSGDAIPPRPTRRGGQGVRTPRLTKARAAALVAERVAALAPIRRALLDQPLDDALRVAGQTLEGVFAPAAIRVWLADPAPWLGEASRAGGLELPPALRLRLAIGPLATQPRAAAAPEAAESAAPPADPIVEHVLAHRRPLLLTPDSDLPAPELCLAAYSLGDGAPSTLVAYPLAARGDFLGVLLLATGLALTDGELAALEVVADMCAVAAEHERLVSYSRSQEALAQTVVRHAPVAVAVLTGPEYVFALANPAFAQLVGVEGSLRGARLAEIVTGAWRLRESFRLDAVYATGEPQAMIELPIHLDRGLTYWNVTCSPLPGRTARVGGVLVAAVDVTRHVMERQRALEAAEVAQERIGQMMALHATSLAVASQLGADPRELLGDILRRSIALLDARAGTVYVADWRVGELEAIVSQGLRGDYVGARLRMGQGLAGKVGLTGQGLLVDDMRLFPTSPAIYAGEAVSAVIAVPLIHHGAVVGVLEVLDDADRRTFTSDDLWLLDLFAAQAAQAIENARNYVELERAYRAQRDLDRMKDDFIATASHELRTPLTGVQGFLDLLLDYPGSRDEPRALSFLQKASDSAAELAELAERLLQTSRLDTGRVELHPAPVDMRALVNDVLAAQADRLAIGAGGHVLHADVPEDAWVFADRDRLKEVLDNLIGNAIKYSPRRGAVHISCGRADVLPAGVHGESGVRDPDPLPAGSLPATSSSGRLPMRAPLDVDQQPTTTLPLSPATSPGAPTSPAAEDGPAYLTLFVSDEGMGIAADERSRLFGRFSRLDAARTSQIRGTGLGLYICRQLVVAMGGAIWLHESTPGRGSTFALALPATSPRATLTDDFPDELASTRPNW